MTEDPKHSRPVLACRFVTNEDMDPRNAVLFKEPETIDDWVASLNRCNEIVEEHLDDLEQQILGTQERP